MNQASIHGGLSARRSKCVDTFVEWKISQALLPGMRALSRYHIEFKMTTLDRLGIIAWRAPWGRAPVVAFSKQMHSVRPYDSCVVGYNSLADFDSNYLMFLTGSMSDVYFWYY